MLRSERFAPTRARALRRVDADSSQGELTAEVIFRSAPFKFAPTQLALIAQYCEQHPRYGVFQWGLNKWFYNRDLMLEVLTEEELEEKRARVIETVKGGWNVAMLSGVALEIAVEKALEACEEFDSLYMNVYIPQYNPYGREIDFIATTRFVGSRKVYPQVYIGEIKLTKVNRRHIENFYDKLRHIGWVRVGSKETLRISNEVSLKLTKRVPIPVWVISGNVTPIYVGLTFTKDAIAECKKLGVIWVYADNLLEILEKRLRRKIYSGRIVRVVDGWVKEQRASGGAFVSRKHIKDRLRKLLHQKLGI